MKNLVRVIVLMPVVFWCSISASLAQDAVPTEILTRTCFIKVGNEAGTAFTIDEKGKLYLVTARHVVGGVPESNAIIQIHQADMWKDYHTVKTLYPSSTDVDIAVFETNETATQHFEVEPMGDGDAITMGQQVWFIGYPFGMGSPVGEKSALFSPGTVLPFMKRGTM
jgi:S1-C subfamily serine protease